MVNHMILTLISAAYVVLGIFCFMESRRRVMQHKKFVCLPQYMLWIGILCGGIFLSIAWLAAISDGSLGLTVCFGCFTLLSMSLMLGWKNCCIAFDKEGFTQKKLFGQQRAFTYDQVTAWGANQRNPMESSLYADGKKISFNLLSDHAPEFIVAVSAGYRKSHGKKNIPELPALNRDRGGFRAHVYNPGEYLAVFIMLIVFIVGLGTWVVIDGLQPIDEKDCQLYTVAFSSWEIQEDSIVLTTPQMAEPFVIGGYTAHLSHFDLLTKMCDGNTAFAVWAKRFDPDDAEPFYRVYALSSGEIVFRTFDDSNAHQREALPMSIGIFGAFLIIFLLFAGFIYIVGSYPEKFPKWVVYCCFKKDAIRID